MPPPELRASAIVRARCVNCGAHTPARLAGGDPAGHCAVCGAERLERVTEADGAPAPPPTPLGTPAARPNRRFRRD